MFSWFGAMIQSIQQGQATPAVPIFMLFVSNIFMTFAWYGHLKTLRESSILLVIFVSWSIAFFEYLLQVPANRIGASHFSLSQLKIIQETLTMLVFAGFSVWYMKIPLKLDYLWAAMCLVGANYFIFRST